MKVSTNIEAYSAAPFSGDEMERDLPQNPKQLFVLILVIVVVKLGLLFL
ncbi:MAG: hypothetical protein ACPGXL_03770 [Chitinophagales bacterium]